MEIINVRINNATVVLDDRDRLSARMNFEAERGCVSWEFILTNSIDVQRLVKLMNYAGAYYVEGLDGKIVRIVNCASSLRGFGDPIKEKFIPTFGEQLKELTITEFEELLKTK